MRLVTIGGRIHALTTDGRGAVDLGGLTGLPSDPASFLARGGVAAATALLPGARPDVVPLPRLDAPVPRPRMVWAIGLNYRDHVAETGGSLPEVPTVFVKSPGAVIGPDEAIVVPPHVTQPDYEGEVAVVIGRRGRDVPEDEALDHVAGVTCAHDVSSRDHQFVTGQWSWSKSFDTFCPLGPVLVTPDEVDVDDVPLETRLNGEVVQASRTSQMVFPIARLVAHLSRGTTLEPGDVILTGTPAGVGVARTPPRWLVDGDMVEVSVGGVGTLRNPVVRP